MFPPRPNSRAQLDGVILPLGVVFCPFLSSPSSVCPGNGCTLVLEGAGAEPRTKIRPSTFGMGAWGRKGKVEED